MFRHLSAKLSTTSGPYLADQPRSARRTSNDEQSPLSTKQTGRAANAVKKPMRCGVKKIRNVNEVDKAAKGGVDFLHTTSAACCTNEARRPNIAIFNVYASRSLARRNWLQRMNKLQSEQWTMTPTRNTKILKHECDFFWFHFFFWEMRLAFSSKQSRRLHEAGSAFHMDGESIINSLLSEGSDGNLFAATRALFNMRKLQANTS